MHNLPSILYNPPITHLSNNFQPRLVHKDFELWQALHLVSQTQYKIYIVHNEVLQIQTKKKK